MNATAACDSGDMSGSGQPDPDDAPPTARLVGPDDWPGGEPHWDDVRYVTAAYLHAARKCFPDAPAGIMHRRTVVMGMIFGGGARGVPAADH